MKTKRNIGLMICAAVLIMSILACGGSPATPTNPPPPPATNTPVPPPPTATQPPVVEPTATEAVAVEPTATEETTTGGDERTPGQINILKVASFKDSFDDWNIIGLVANDTDRIVEDIQIEVEIFDASNVSIYKNTDSVTLDLYTVGPGEITPFHLWVTDDLPGADTFVATVIGNNVSSAERGLAEIGEITQLVDEYDTVYLIGEVTNTDSQPILVSGIAAATFDAAGEMIAAASESVSLHYLDPGESGPFRINLTGAEGSSADVTDFEIYTDIQIYSEQPSYDISGLDDMYDYMDGYDNIHLVGEFLNNEAKALNISAIAAIYDADGKILDACSGSVAFYPASGEKVPFDCDSWGPLNWIDGTYDTADTYVIFIDRYWTWEAFSEEITLTSSEDEASYDGDQGTFTGKAVNNSAGKVDSATVVIAIYDSSGKLIATDWDWIFDEIDVNGTADYEVYVSLPPDFVKENATIVVIVKGTLP